MVETHFISNEKVRFLIQIVAIIIGTLSVIAMVLSWLLGW